MLPAKSAYELSTEAREKRAAVLLEADLQLIETAVVRAAASGAYSVSLDPSALRGDHDSTRSALTRLGYEFAHNKQFRRRAATITISWGGALRPGAST